MRYGTVKTFVLLKKNNFYKQSYFIGTFFKYYVLERSTPYPNYSVWQPIKSKKYS